MPNHHSQDKGGTEHQKEVILQYLYIFIQLYYELVNFTRILMRALWVVCYTVLSAEIIKIICDCFLDGVRGSPSSKKYLLSQI